MKKTKQLCVVILFCFLCIACTKIVTEETDTDTMEMEFGTEENDSIREKTVVESGQEYSVWEEIPTLAPGINLGCSLDCFQADAEPLTGEDTAVKYYETLFGNHQISRENIEFLKEEGFQTVRIPITYRNHMTETGKISEEWMNRVQEVVDYVVDNDMYCIINIHHDTGGSGWITADESNYQENKEKVAYMWKQIAMRFKDYDDRLIFEGFNEILNAEHAWNMAGDEAYRTANQYNQLFVDTVRLTGGENAKRYLIVNTYAASVEEDVVSHFILPEDRIENHLIVGTHCYFGSDRIDEVFDRLNQYFISQNIPVVMGEFGRQNDNDEVSRMLYVKKYLRSAAKYHIDCLWWDDGGNYSSSEQIRNFAILNRSENQWFFEKTAEILVKYS